MKKFVLIAAAAAALAVSAASPASALTIIKPGVVGGGHHHSHGWWGGGLSIGLIGDTGYASDCYYARRTAFVPGIGYVAKRQLVCY
ncbi:MULTISPECIES: hypothetical protein [unclassified Bradyrhizobium]|uniref:hypothetical protein n=1 Tax=unclassified Bradyrhizobium TaxID=2631580 RepID=UPI001BABA9AB|nr:MULTISPECIES: hypothetical protein [unclassified Bradyrhizobium]MBR1227757.1 hypothetical protein [Bradyrhizobium sp. AUGA SZCCT0176]MBR1302050.1 hypothetical protein [Bradyrhizobium sp. AUGA SZCCT0042]